MLWMQKIIIFIFFPFLKSFSVVFRILALENIHGQNNDDWTQANWTQIWPDEKLARHDLDQI